MRKNILARTTCHLISKRVSSKHVTVSKIAKNKKNVKYISDRIFRIIYINNLYKCKHKRPKSTVFFTLCKLMQA